MRIYIDSSELPATSVIDRDGVPHISVAGADAGTWKASGNHGQARKWALEYLAAAYAMEEWQSKQAVLERARLTRRDELARELAGGIYVGLIPELRHAIDRIIELEDAK